MKNRVIEYVLLVSMSVLATLMILNLISDKSCDIQQSANISLSNDTIQTVVTIDSIYAMCDYYGIKQQNIVVAQAILETGHFSSKLFKQQNNMFGMKKVSRRVNTQSTVDSKSSYATYDNWKYSLLDYGILQYKFANTNTRETYYEWLTKSGYAEDPGYIKKLKNIVNQLDDKYGIK